VRQTKTDIDEGLKGVGPAKRTEYYEELAEQIRSQDIRCMRCQGQAFAMLGTDNKYKCHSCDFEFEGLPHIPAKSE